MKRIFAVLCAAVGLLTVAMGSTGLCEQKYPSGDIGLPPDYEQTILKYQDAILGYDSFVDQLPSAFNWKTRGKVTPAKDQGDCGSCYAFAAAGTLESKLLIKYKITRNLSEQQQISCNTGMAGCSGGSMSSLQYWETAGPWLESCSGYPSYDGSEPDCSTFNCRQLEWRTKDYYTVDMTAVSNIKTSLYTDGPSYFRFDYYSDFSTFWNKVSSGAVYTQTSGSYQGIGHAVLLIGWSDSKGAWLLKNSWGETAGPNGDGTFWMAYTGHANNLNLGMANVHVKSTKALLKQKKLMFLRKPSSTGPYGIRIFAPPSKVGGSLGSALAGSDKLGTTLLDMSAANFASKTGEELVVLRKTSTATKRNLSLYYPPSAPNQNMKSPFATATIASKGKFVASGDFNKDGGADIAVVQWNSTKKVYSLSIYEPPEKVGGTATLIASSPDVGSNVMGLAAGDYDRDNKAELFVLKGNSTAAGLYVYTPPTAIDAEMGDPIASAPSIGSGVIGIAAANFDKDQTNIEVAILAKAATGKRNLKIYRPPTKPNGSLGILVASVNSVDTKFIGVKALLFTADSQSSASNANDEISAAAADE